MASSKRIRKVVLLPRWSLTSAWGSATFPTAFTLCFPERLLRNTTLTEALIEATEGHHTGVTLGSDGMNSYVPFTSGYLPKAESLSITDT